MPKPDKEPMVDGGEPFLFSISIGVAVFAIVKIVAMVLRECWK